MSRCQGPSVTRVQDNISQSLHLGSGLTDANTMQQRRYVLSGISREVNGTQLLVRNSSCVLDVLQPLGGWTTMYENRSPYDRLADSRSLGFCVLTEEDFGRSLCLTEIAEMGVHKDFCCNEFLWQRRLS